MKHILIETEAHFIDDHGNNVSVMQRNLRGQSPVHFIKRGGGWCQFEGTLKNGFTIEQLFTNEYLRLTRNIH